MWLDYLEYGYFKVIDMGLDCIKLVVLNLDLFYFVFYVIIVVGMNGKGLICCFLEVVLMKFGLKVGVYFFLYFFCYNECVWING